MPQGRGRHARMQFMVYIHVIVTDSDSRRKKQNKNKTDQTNLQSWIEKGANTTLLSRSHFASLFRK